MRNPALAFGANGQNRQITLASQALGQRAGWNLRGTRFITLPTHRFRVCVFRVDDAWAGSVNLNTFADNMSTYLRNNGFAVNTQGFVQGVGSNANRQAFAANLSAAYTTIIVRTRPDNIRLLIVALPSKDAKIYANVKWWADCLQGVPTVCVTKDSLEGNWRAARGNFDLSYLGNLRYLLLSSYLML